MSSEESPALAGPSAITSSNLVYDALRRIYGHLCHGLSTNKFAALLDLFPTGEIVTQCRHSYDRLEQANLIPQALAVCLFCVFEALLEPSDIPTLLPRLVNTFQRLERQWDNLPNHTGSTDALYNHVFGLLAVRSVSDKAITMQDLQRIFQTHNSNDQTLHCFNDWLARSEAVQVRGNRPTEAERVPFSKNIWTTIRTFLDDHWRYQAPQQHLLIQIMRNMATWHAALCILEGIRDAGVDVFVTSWGTPLQPQQNAEQNVPQLPAPTQSHPQTVPSSQPTGLGEQHPGQEANERDPSPAWNNAFPHNQQLPGVSVFEDRGHPDAGSGASTGRPGAAFPHPLSGLSAPPRPQQADSGANRFSDSRANRPRCARCAASHTACDRDRPCGGCRKAGRGWNECIPRPSKRKKARVQDGGKRTPAAFGGVREAEVPESFEQIAVVEEGYGEMGQLATTVQNAGKPASAAFRGFGEAEQSVGTEDFGEIGQIATASNMSLDMKGHGEADQGAAGEEPGLTASHNFYFGMDDMVVDPLDGDYRA